MLFLFSGTKIKKFKIQRFKIQNKNGFKIQKKNSRFKIQDSKLNIIFAIKTKHFSDD